MNNRIKTIQTILKGSCIAAEPELNNIVNEFSEVLNTKKIQPLRRRNLIQLLHSTRGVDSALAVFLRHKHLTIANNNRSLGKYLKKMLNPQVPGVGSLTPNERLRYEHSIVRPRNRFVHQAGTNPTNHEIQTILGEMAACLTRVLGL